MLTRLSAKTFLTLGALVGLFEALSIVRYDWLMGDWALARMLIGLGWAAAIVLIDVVGWGLLGAICRWRAPPAIGLGVWLIWGCRSWTGDRFVMWSLLPALLATLLSLRLGKRPGLIGVIAVSIGLVALWGRVPIYTTPSLEQLFLWLPGIAAVSLVGLRPGQRSVAAAAVVLAVMSVPRMLSPASASEDRPPSVLFVLVDTLRVDHVAPYGDRGTPSTARLAEEGMIFTDAITVIPKTTQSIAAFQTGKYPINSGVRRLSSRLPAEQRTLAEHLSDHDYRTGAMVHNGWVSRGRGFDQGFDQFWSFFELEQAWGPLRYTGLVAAADVLTVGAVRKFDANTDAAVLTDRALSWLDETPSDQPFYLYLHYLDPHWPYRPPGLDAGGMVNNINSNSRWGRGDMIFNNPLPDSENERAMSLYGHEVEHNLDQVGRLLEWLDESGRADDTIVVFTADHGHHLGDHNYWFHHGAFLYEPGIQIPLLVRYPDGVAAGSAEDRQFRSIDLAPTLLDLMSLPPLVGIDGIAQSEITTTAPAFLETDTSYFGKNKRRKIKGKTGKVRGVRQGRWKLHFTPNRTGGLWELFDLQADPGELTNLLEGEVPPEADLPGMFAVLVEHIPQKERDELVALGHDFGQPPISPRPQVLEGANPDAATEEDDTLNANDASMLEALGYIE
ncbi:MAG: arylsulfatase A-like enzyme [Myxococcota bacterium]|jgi:arylsulfatase A-like enzyme